MNHKYISGTDKRNDLALYRQGLMNFLLPSLDQLVALQTSFYNKNLGLFALLVPPLLRNMAVRLLHCTDSSSCNITASIPVSISSPNLCRHLTVTARISCRPLLVPAAAVSQSILQPNLLVPPSQETELLSNNSVTSSGTTL
jgi:hypothetical protein